MTGQSTEEKGKALSAVIALLFDYLEAFTVHARFTNIYDQAEFKDAYFDKPFPRSLAGQLVHDCGVYAMRVAYILSLVSQELGLRFRFIRLPAHLGLIITGEGLPMFVAHNDHFKETPQKSFRSSIKAGIRRARQLLHPKGGSKDAASKSPPAPTERRAVSGRGGY